MTTALMLLMLATYAAIAIFGVKYLPGKKNFFDLSDTTVLKGLFCIIVVLVHIPAEYQNPIQDAVGSFAYIGVTFFFMTSSFGLMYSAEHKKDYIKRFWQNRLPPLLIPALLCNAIDIAVKAFGDKQITFWNIVHINAWVRVLLLYYLIFWIVKIIPDKFAGGGYWKDIIVCTLIMLISLICRLINRDLPLWFVESYGFIYGIVLYDLIDKFKEWSDRKWAIKTGLLFLISLIFGVLYIKLKPVEFWGDYCLRIVLGLSLTLLILMVIRRYKIGNIALMFLGTISYEVYLLHGVAFGLMAFIYPNSSSGVFIILSITITLLISVIINRISKVFLKAIRQC